MIENRKAQYEYEILETYECGMKLEGHEVKAIASGKCSLVGSHGKIMNSIPVLIGASIGDGTVDMLRTRTLLLHKKEIVKLIGKTQERGLTLIPLKIYQVRGKFKLSLGLCKGKKEYDKRATEKKRDIENDNRRIVKSQKLETA